MKITPVICIVSLALCAACSSEPPARPVEQAQQKPAAPPVPPEIQAAANAVLGGETEVLVFGDLAKNGQVQALAINRLAKRPENVAPGNLLTRAAIVSKDGATWKELFRVDEHLKNTNGFLAATPVSPVSGWRLQYEQNAETGLQMYFTPLQQPKGGYVMTIGVRWNPKVKRYQSLDRTYTTFLGEAPALERLSSYLK